MARFCKSFEEGKTNVLMCSCAHVLTRVWGVGGVVLVVWMDFMGWVRLARLDTSIEHRFDSVFLEKLRFINYL